MAVGGLPAWPHFSSAARAGHIQVSALGQLLGQNGNIASMVRPDIVWSSDSKWTHSLTHSVCPKFNLPTGRESVSSSEEYPPPAIITLFRSAGATWRQTERELLTCNQNNHSRAPSDPSCPGTTPPSLMMPRRWEIRRTTMTTRRMEMTMTSLMDSLGTLRD